MLQNFNRLMPFLHDKIEPPEGSSNIEVTRDKGQKSAQAERCHTRDLLYKPRDDELLFSVLARVSL
jgi:hypothetical protein